MYPRLNVYLNKVEKNAKSIKKLCDKFGIEIFGVTKVTCADIRVAQTLLQSGIKKLADSRVENLIKLKRNFPHIKTLLLRLPMKSEIPSAVKYCDYMLISSVESAFETDKYGGVKIIFMFELGDLREGMPVEKIREIEKLKNLKHSSLEGVGVNLACFGGVIPTREKMEKLLDIKNTVEKILDKKIKIISGGNSSSLPLLIENNMPEGVNMLRIGETIMLGTNVIDRSAFPETFQDTFVFEAEIIELYDKPSVPDGKIGQDAFGNVPMFEDKGIMKRAIIACGRQDIDPEGLIPLGNYEVLGASSDHVIVDVTNYKYDLRIGDTLKFIPNYSALLRAYTSSYVKKYYYES